MHTEESSLVIEKVDVETFDDFLGLIAKLAEYEKLSLPNAEAKQRLRRDCLSDKPKYQDFLEDIFVLEEYRRNRVGKKMFDFIKATTKREGCGRRVYCSYME